MDNKKFCKFCGEQIDKESIVCPKCGRQIQNVSDNKEIKVDTNKSSVETKPKFYEQNWFMWIMLIFFAPVGIFLMWKFHPEMKNNTKKVLTIVFAIFFIMIMVSANNEDNENSDSTNQYSTNKKVEVTVTDFSTMEKSNVENWCRENKVNCKITDEYSDTIEKGLFVSQSINANTTIYEGEKINIIYSLGKKPTNGEVNALRKAESYSKTMHMSKQGIYNQLTSAIEGFSDEEAQYAIDNIKADWNKNALEKAKSYQQTMSMSKNAIYNQLTSSIEGFTNEEAQYAIDHLDD